MKRSTILFAICLLFPAFICQGIAASKKQNVHLPQIEIKSYKKETAKPKRKIQLQYSLLTPEQTSAKELNQLVTKMIQDKLKTFLKDSTKTIENFSSSFSINDSVLFYKPGQLISIQYEEFTYIAGSAHPNTTHFVINYDLAHKKLLSLQDILIEPQTDLEFISNFAKKILKARDLGKVNFIEQGAAPLFKNYKNWNFTDSGLLVVFDPYQVAAYVYGPQSVTIPYKELTGHIKPDYFEFLPS